MVYFSFKATQATQGLKLQQNNEKFRQELLNCEKGRKVVDQGSLPHEGDIQL